jgi:hypothetical protein
VFGWLKRRAELASLRAATEDMERFLAGLQGGTSEEMGGVVATATLIRLYLREEGILPDELLGIGLHPTPDQEIAVIVKLPRYIQLLQQKDQLADAAGVMVWLHTVRAIVLYPELRNKGREIWRELARGFSHAPQALRDKEEFFGTVIPPQAYDMVDFVPPPLMANI